MHDIATLDDYMTRYAPLLGEKLAQAVDPLHVPGRDPLPEFDVKRHPFEAQAHCVAAGVKHLKDNKSLLLIAECGTGKSLMGAVITHERAAGRPYRAIIMCPPHLVGKWKRELEMTLDCIKVTILRTYATLTQVKREKPTRAEWYIVSENMAKLGPKWRPAYLKSRRSPGIAFCADCGEPVLDYDPETEVEVPVPIEKLGKRKYWCSHCQSPLWTWTHSVDRWPIASYIKTKMRGMFDALIVDEVHQQKTETSARATAMGTMAAVSKRVVAMTGTLIGGKANDVRSMLFRLSPNTLTDEGFGWDDYMRFNERYGRIETVVTETRDREAGGEDNRNSRGSSRSSRKSVRPGIMPTLFGRHLLDKTIFLSLDELAEELPELDESGVIAVDMDVEQAAAYKTVETALRNAVKEALKSGDRRLLSMMLHVLLGYADHPYGYPDIGYWDSDDDGNERWVHVVTPPELDRDTIRPKEQTLLDYILKERTAGRQCWVFVQMTDKRDVLPRLQSICESADLTTKILRAATPPPAKREDWIMKNGHGTDVVFSHPALVQTGLDLFDPGGSHNFVTLIFYQTGYNLFTLRQASRRAWRIGQTDLCKVAYLYYNDTMQADAMDLMGQKLEAAEALEGKFSSEGLAAMAEDSGSAEMALARSLVKRIDRSSVQRRWKRIRATAGSAAKPDVLPLRRAPRFIQRSLFDELPSEIRVARDAVVGYFQRPKV